MRIIRSSLWFSAVLALNAQAASVQFNFGAGFSDATAVAPVAGNGGTTLGQQRKNLFSRAAAEMADIIASDVVIRIDAHFASLGCSSHVEGSAFYDVNPSLPYGSVFWPHALEDALTGLDNDPGSADMALTANSNVDDALCFGGSVYYYGFDDNAPGGTIRLFPEVLHAIVHGLGFDSLIESSDGSFPNDTPSVYDLFIRDVDANEYWVDMTDGERFISMTNDPDIIWDGAQVTNNAGMFTSTGFNSGGLRLHAPSPFEPERSIRHFTDAAGPTDLLMEPQLGNSAYNQIDVTPYLLQDLGYTVDFDALNNRIFEDDWDGCTLNAWSAVTGTPAAGGLPNIPVYAGTCAMSVDVGDFVTDLSPLDESKFVTRFYFLPPESGNATIMVAYQDESSATPVFTVQASAATVTVMPNDGGLTAMAPVSSGEWNAAEIEWNAGGQINLWVNRDARSEPENAAGNSGNEASTISSVELGLLNDSRGISTITIDEYVSVRALPIGLIPPDDFFEDGFEIP